MEGSLAVPHTSRFLQRSSFLVVSSLMAVIAQPLATFNIEDFLHFTKCTHVLSHCRFFIDGCYSPTYTNVQPQTVSTLYGRHSYIFATFTVLGRYHLPRLHRIGTGTNNWAVSANVLQPNTSTIIYLLRANRFLIVYKPLWAPYCSHCGILSWFSII